MNKENIRFHMHAIGDNLNEGYPVTITTKLGHELVLNSDWNHGNIRYYFTYRNARYTYSSLDGMINALARKKFGVKDIKF